LAPILRAAIERAAVRPGKRVVDVGCGTGATSIELGGRVGLSGHVLGVDVSGPMLATAKAKLAGFWVDKQESTNTNYVVSAEPDPTPEEWDEKYVRPN
jgi:ubiquinone/menaquinone biosynthesis C-methylase UbiE